MKYNGDYFVGLDMGTDSVGWAVTDTSYNLLKCNQKTMWGARLFNEAQTAEATRLFRTNRRRLARRKQRIHWLQELFDAEISKTDPLFFARLQESKFETEDKKYDGKLGQFALFNDPGFTDKEFYKEYPTIYHLRNALLTEKGPFDVRLVYLAIHHIIKNRGHFLFDSSMGDDSTRFEVSFKSLCDYLDSEYDVIFKLKNEESFKKNLKDRSLGVNSKKKLLREDVVLSPDSIEEGQDSMSEEQAAIITAVTDMLAGATVKFADLYQDEELNDAELKSFSLTDDFDSKETDLEAVLGDRIELIRYIKAVYDWSILDNILQGHNSISAAKVSSYEKHHNDLVKLKKAIKTFCPDAYKEIFHQCADGLDNYPAYSGKTPANYQCDYPSFSKFIKNKLKNIENPTAEVAEIINELDIGTFLPKQVVKSNGVIPNQVNRKELLQILNNASAYLPFLSEKDKDGKTVSDKIISIFDYHIPYYVGPLNKASRFFWVDRSNEKIYPWNFKEVVNLDTSAEKFITRMTAFCTYLHSPAFVLPRESLLYSEYTVLNELNNLCINGKRISPELKNNIYNNLFMTNKKVTQKKLINYLRSTCNYQSSDVISGIDGDFKSSLKPFLDFKEILKRTDDKLMVEDIIRHITLFGDDRKILSSWMKKTYQDKLSSDDIKFACRLKYAGWGRLSSEFLTQVYHVDSQTGEAFSIIDMLRGTSNNLMELLSDRFGFLQSIDEYKQTHGSMATSSIKEYIDASYASPSIKRAILQTTEIMDEIVKIMHRKKPKRVFVEMTRRPDEKKERTISRKNSLIELYKKCHEESTELFASLENKNDGDLRRDKLYLYYTQLGKCMYSGEPIDIDKLDTDYDIDHIFPQCKTKDDSLSNRVLVKRNLNSAKGDTYPISSEIRNKCASFWLTLKTKELISQKKYDRLTRSTPLTDAELADFIARQVVETSQSTKLIAEILAKQYGKQTDIVYSKAKNVSEFRQSANEKTKSLDFIKCREVNDFHHAKDAYLNIVVGNVYFVKFTRSPLKYIQDGHKNDYSLNRVFDYSVVRNNETAWIPDENGTMETVHRMIKKNNVLITRFAYEADGGLYKQTILPKGNGQALIKSSDTRMTIDKFGGYDKVTGSYFFLVEHTIKNKRERSIETVFLMNKASFEKNPVKYCVKEMGLIDPIILIDKIKIDSLFSYDGFLMNVSGRTGSQIIFKNANELILSSNDCAYIKNISKYLNRCKKANNELVVTIYDDIDSKRNIELYETLQQKISNRPYSVLLKAAEKELTRCNEIFISSSIYNQCLALNQITNIFACKSVTANLKAVGGNGTVGLIRISKNLSNFQGKHFEIINSSITGIFMKSFDLLGDLSRQSDN